MLIISDTSALSALAETGLLHLLPNLVGKVTITHSVHRECLDAGAPIELRNWIAIPPEWVSLVPDPDAFLEETSALGAGEASAITLAWQHRPTSRLILDEKRGRKVARALGLKMTGVLALAADAAIAGRIDFEEAIRRLKAANFRIAESLIQEARQRVKILPPESG